MMKIKIKIVTLTLLVSAILFTVDAYSQNSPADDYYNNNIGTQNPSEVYYNKNLRAGPPTGPGGGGEGGNGGVGTEDPEPLPLNSPGYSLLLAGMAYTAFIIYRKYKRTNKTIDS